MSDTKSRGAGFDDEAVEAVLTGRASGSGDPVASVLAALRATSNGRPPEPTAELKALLERGRSGDELAVRRKRRRGMITGAIVVGAASLTLSGVAAAHDALPGPAQNVIRGIVNAITPFDIDAPARRGGVPRPVDTGRHQRTEVAGPTMSSTAPGQGGSTNSSGDDHGGGPEVRSKGPGDGGSEGPSTSGSSGSRDGSGGGGGSDDGGSPSPSPSASTSSRDGGDGGGPDGGGGGSDGSGDGGGSSDGSNRSGG